VDILPAGRLADAASKPVSDGGLAGAGSIKIRHIRVHDHYGCQCKRQHRTSTRVDKLEAFFTHGFRGRAASPRLPARPRPTDAQGPGHVSSDSGR